MSYFFQICSLQVSKVCWPGTREPLQQLPPLPELISLNSSGLFVGGEEDCSETALAEILQQTPFYISLGKNRAGGELTEQAVVRLLRETRREIEEKLGDNREYQTEDIKLRIRNKLRMMITPRLTAPLSLVEDYEDMMLLNSSHMSWREDGAQV